MNDDEWKEYQQKFAFLDTGKDVEFLAELDQENQRFKKRFPVWTSVETAFYRKDDSILLVVNTPADGDIPRTHGSRVYKPGDTSCQEIFDRHKFNERSDNAIGSSLICWTKLEKVGAMLSNGKSA